MAAIVMTEAEIKRLFQGLRKPGIGLFNKWVQFLLQINGDTGGLLDVTYAELTALIGGGTLEPGQYYRITDFVSTIDIPNDPGGGQSVGGVEPLIVFATSSGTININALSEDFPTDLIEYSVGDASFGALTGRITRRVITAQDSEAPFDVRVADFIRWETAPGSTIFTVINDNGGANQLARAFLVGNTGVDADNVIIRNFEITGSAPLSPNIVIEQACSDIDFGVDSINCTVLTTCQRITTDSRANGITILAGCSDIHAGTQFTASTIGAGSSFINFGNDCGVNNVGVNGEFINFGDQCEINVIGDNCRYITLLSDCSDNLLGDFIDHVTFENRNFSNSIGSSSQFIHFYDQVANITVGDSCARIRIGFGSGGHIFGASCQDITIGDGTGTLTFTTLLNNITIGNQVTNETYAAGSSWRVEELTWGEQYYSYDFFLDGGAQGDIILSNLPNVSTIIFGLLQATTAPTTGSGNAMLSFGVATDDTAGLLAPTQHSNAIFTSGTWMNMIPLWLDATFTVQSTAIRNLIMTIANEDLTNGVINSHIKYNKKT